MARVKLIKDKSDVASEYAELFDELMTRRGRISGPSTVVLHSIGLARPWNEVSEFLQERSSVEPRNFELAICATAREYDCGYIWGAHQPRAVAAGVADTTVDVVRSFGTLDSLPEHDALIVGLVRQLIRTNRVEPATFSSLLEQHDERWMVELLAYVGRYGALAGILNAFEVPPNPGVDQLPGRREPIERPASVRPPEPSPRIKPLTSPEQVDETARKGIFEELSEGRGNVRGPWAMLMYSPELCKVILDVSNYLRQDNFLTGAERELASIATARARDCPYVWAAHAPAARKEGVPDATNEGVRDRIDPVALPAADRDIVEYTMQLLHDHSVDQDLFDRLLSAHSIPWLVELTALIGHYTFVTGLLNALEVSPAPDAEALPLS